MALNPLDLAGRTFLVTGASSGIGRETCVLLSRLGARVALLARDKVRLEETLAAMEPREHLVESCDLAETAGIPERLAQLARRSGPLDGLVHCAGVRDTCALRFREAQDIARVLRVNLESAFLLAKGFRQRGVRAPAASIVFLSSVAAFTGAPGLADYSASKAGITALTRTLAVELARENIRVNAVAPAWVETEMTRRALESITPDQEASLRARHLLGYGQPRDVANAVAFLLADTARWITGTTLVVDGGYTAH